MATVYTASEIADILALLAPGASQESLDTGRKRGEQLLTDFVDGNADIAPDALLNFQRLIEVCGINVDADGNSKLTELGARALAKFQAYIDALEGQLNAHDENRIHSLTSDQNQIKFDLVTLDVYKQMNLVPSDTDAANLTPDQVTDIINSIVLTDAERDEYADKFIDAIISNNELFEVTPPRILADAYTATRDKLYKEPNNADLQARFECLAKRIDYLIKNFASKADYFIADPSNIADVYAGYRHMCDIREKDLVITNDDNDATKKYKKSVTQNISTTQSRLEEIVSMYSEMWNLNGLKPEDADKLNERWQQISDSLKDVELTDDILATLAKYEFLDADGKPMPQFLDTDGKESLEFKPGYKLNPDGRLNRIIKLAKNDVTMQNVGALSTDVADMDLSGELSNRVPWKMTEISIPDQAASGVTADMPLTQADVDKFWDHIEREGGKLTDAGYQAALDAQVNQAAGFAGILGQKIGYDKAVVNRPFDAVEDIDKLAKSRTEKTGAAERTKKIGLFKRMAKNFGAAAVMSAGLTFIGKATGIAYAGAAVGTTIGIGNMVAQGFKWRREQKKAGRPYDLKTFLSDKRNWGPAAASGLGIAAVISMATGNPELAAGFGISAMTVGGGSAAVVTYQDAINAGYTKGQAIAGAIGIVGATIAGGLAGRAAMNGVINYVNNNTDSNLFKTEHTTTTNRVTGTERTYSDGVIQNNERILQLWESPDQLNTHLNGLMDAGLSHDDAVRYLLAWHDATDHNLGPGYFNSIGISPDALAAFQQSISGGTINITPDAMSAFNQFNPHISAHNTVGYIPGAPVEYGPHANASYDSNGVLVPGNDVYSTYVEHAGNVFSETPIITSEQTSIFTPNELLFPAGIGTLGVYHPRVVPDEYLNRLRERAGALADRMRKDEEKDANDKDDKDDKDAPNVKPGKDGKDGKDGKNGKDGKDGKNGKDGKDGKDGRDGDKQRGFIESIGDYLARFQHWTGNRIRGTQKLIGELKMQKIQNETQREIARVDLEKARNKRRMAVLSGEAAEQMKKLTEDIKRQKKALEGKEDLADLKQKREIQRRLAQLDALSQEVAKFRKMGGEDAYQDRIKLAELENKLKVLEAQGDIDVKKTRAQGENEINKIKDEGKIEHAGNVSQRIASFFKGFRRVTDQDIDSARKAKKLAKEKFAKAKTDAARKVWDKANKRLADLMASHEYTQEQKDEIAAKVVQEALRQADAAK